MRDQDTEYAIARANDLARNEREERERAATEARVALEVSADYQHPVDNAVVRNARLVRFSVAHGCADPRYEAIFCDFGRFGAIWASLAGAEDPTDIFGILSMF